MQNSIFCPNILSSKAAPSDHSQDNVRTIPEELNATSAAISRLANKTFDATKSSELRKETSASHLDLCLQEIGEMYKIAPKTSFPLLGELKERVLVTKRWIELSLDPSLIETDFDSVHFLVKQRTIFTIVGLQNTSDYGKNQLRIESGKISVLCNGTFIPVTELIDRFRYVPQDLQYLEDGTNLPWNYVLPHGFIQVDRCSDSELLPTTQLSQQEMRQLLEHAQKFQGSCLSKGTPPVGVLQIVANPPKRISSNSFLFDGIDTISHIGFRFIDKNGRVFSSGFLPKTDERRFKSGLRNMLASINGSPGLTDYEEFSHHSGRRVTSIPLSQETCSKMMIELQKMRRDGARFNTLTQNCTQMAIQMIQIAGIKINHQKTVYQAMYHLLPSIASLPKVQKLFERVSLAISQKIPGLKKTISLTAKGISLAIYPIKSIANLAINTILMAFGAHKGSPVKKNMYGNSQNDGMRNFFAIISSVRDLFRSTIICHSGPVIAWMDEQKTTLYYAYNRPSMNILPESGGRVPCLKKRPFARFKAP